MFNFFSSKKQNTLVDDISENQNVTLDNISLLYTYIEKHSGIFLDIKKNIIQGKIINFCKTKKIQSINKLLEMIQSNDTLWQEFIDIITINETYFFREKQQVEDALKKYLPITTPLKILSAPSSSGEEVYSIVIMALEMGIESFEVIGIDISQTAILKSKESLYSKRSVHRISKELLDKYFTVEPNGYKLNSEYNKYCKFKECNLFDDSIYSLGKFDIIFSRNMFIYFKDEKKIAGYKRLSKLKKVKSSLICLGHADISSKLASYIRSEL